MLSLANADNVHRFVATKHAARKKLVADRYTKSYVMQDPVAKQIQGHASRFLSQVEKDASSLDVYTWLHYYALE